VLEQPAQPVEVPDAQLTHDPVGGLGVHGREARSGTAQEVALGQWDAQTDQDIELLARLDALGQQPRVEPARQGAEHLDQCPLRLVPVEALDQRPVQLDHVGTQGQHALQS
jgi:hypothetical protein